MLELLCAILFILLFLLGGGVFIFMVCFHPIQIKHYESKEPERDINIKKTRDTGFWAQKNGFRFLGFYNVTFGTRGFMAAWKLKEKPTFFCQYIIKTDRATVTAHDFVTKFKNEIELTTSNTKDSNLFPKPPKTYKQSFSKCGFDERYKLHLAAEKYLITKGGAQIETSLTAFEEVFINSLKAENKYQWKHWYWIFLLLYFCFTRKKHHNKTVQEQHESGEIQLPNEILLIQ